MYGRDLVDELRKDLGGNFEEACVAMLIPYYDYMIECLYKSIKVSYYSELFSFS